MTVHDPKRDKRPGRTMLAWHATCECGWNAEANGPDDADKRAAEHRVVTLVESDILPTLHDECWDTVTLEQYGVEKCLRCRLREALKAAVA